MSLYTTSERHTLGWRSKTDIIDTLTPFQLNHFSICKLPWTLTTNRLRWTSDYFTLHRLWWTSGDFFFNSLVSHVGFSGVWYIAIFTIRICQVRLHRHLSFRVTMSGYAFGILCWGKFKASFDRLDRFIALLNRFCRSPAVILWSFKVILWSHLFDRFKCFLYLFQIILVFFLLMLCAMEHLFRKITEL